MKLRRTTAMARGRKLARLAMCGLVLSAAVASGSTHSVAAETAADAPTYGLPGTQIEQPGGPFRPLTARDLHVDADGVLYSLFNHDVQIFDADGVYSSSFRWDIAPYGRAVSMAVDVRGDITVARPVKQAGAGQSHEIVVFDRTGVVLRQVDVPSPALGLAWGGDDRLYAWRTSSDGYVVEVFDAELTAVDSWVVSELDGTPVTDGDRDPLRSTAFTVGADNTVYIGKHQSVGVFAADGTPLREQVVVEGDVGSDARVLGVAVDADGRLFVNFRRYFSGSTEEVGVWDTDGTRLELACCDERHFGGPNEYPGVGTLALSPSGDHFLGRYVDLGHRGKAIMYRYDSDGNLLGWPEPNIADDQYETATAVAADSAGRIYVAAPRTFTEDGSNPEQGAKIVVFDAAGRFERHWDLPSMKHIEQLAVDASDVLYGHDGYRLSSIGQTGDVIATLVPDVDADEDPSDYAFERIAAGKDGLIYATVTSRSYKDTFTSVQRFMPDGTFVGKWQKRGIADDTLIVDDQSNITLRFNRNMRTFTTTGAPLGEWPLVDADDVFYDWGRRSTVGSDGSIFVMGAFGGIRQFSADGTLISTWSDDSVPASDSVRDLTFAGDSLYITTEGSMARLQLTEVDPPSNPTITINVDSQPGSKTNFAFGGTLGQFRLDDPDVDDGDAYTSSAIFDAVDGETYRIATRQFSQWTLTDIACSPAATAAVNLDKLFVLVTPDGDDVECTFVMERKPAASTQQVS